MSGRVVHVNDNVEGAVYVGRANGRKHPVGAILGNPFVIPRDGTRAEVVIAYRDWLPRMLPHYPAMIDALIDARGKPLACWCRHDGEEKRIGNACHADVILELLDRYADDELRAFGVKR